MQGVSPKVEGRQNQGCPGWGYCQKPYIKMEVFKGNTEGCKKYIFISCQGYNKQAAQHTRAIKGLCKHIEKKLEMGQMIVKAIKNKQDVEICLPDDPDLINPNAVKKIGRENIMCASKYPKIDQLEREGLADHLGAK